MKPLYKIDQLTGNYNVHNLIKKSLMRNSLTYFTILDGDHGTGKTTMAKMIALYITCESNTKQETGNPCGQCKTCKENWARVIMANRSSTKVHVLDIAQHNADIKQLITQMFKLQTEGDVFILDEAHNLTKDEQSALLVEIENNTDSHIIMCTTKAYTFLPELKSRGNIFKFKRLKTNEAKLLINKTITERKNEILKSEGGPYEAKLYDLEDHVKDMIISYSKGTPRDIIRLVDFIATTEPSMEEIEEHLGIVGAVVYLDILEASQLDLVSFKSVLMDYEAQYGASTIIRGFKDFIIDAIYRLEGSVMGTIGNKGFKTIKLLGYFKLNSILTALTESKKNSYDVMDLLGLGIKIRNIILNITDEQLIIDRYKDGSVLAEQSRELALEIKREETEEKSQGAILSSFSIDDM